MKKHPDAIFRLRKNAYSIWRSSNNKKKAYLSVNNCKTRYEILKHSVEDDKSEFIEQYSGFILAVVHNTTVSFTIKLKNGKQHTIIDSHGVLRGTLVNRKKTALFQ